MAKCIDLRLFAVLTATTNIPIPYASFDSYYMEVCISKPNLLELYDWMVAGGIEMPEFNEV